MPVLRPGVIHYAVATKQVTHGDPTVEDGVAGFAIKTKEQSWTEGIANRDVVQIGEDFSIGHKGETHVKESLFDSPPAKGDPVFIKESDNSLSTEGGAGYVKFGRVTTIAPDSRGTPAGVAVVDMDGRDSL